MSTRSMIGIEGEDGKIRAVYCHWDGYLEHNGRILLNNYVDRDKIEELVNLGSLSFLSEEIGEKHKFETAVDEHRNWCCAYHRDRGDDLDISEYNDQKDYIRIKDWTEFWYLFTKDGEWLYSIGDEFKPLTMEACDND